MKKKKKREGMVGWGGEIKEDRIRKNGKGGDENVLKGIKSTARSLTPSIVEGATH